MAKKHSFDYFEAFVKAVDSSCAAASLLNETLRNFDPDRLEEAMTAMHEIEHAADGDKHQMMKVLIREFLPPIEREDVTELTQKIDDVTDALEDVLVKIYTFNIPTIRPEALEFMDIIVACCCSLKRDCIIEVNDLEGEGDLLYTRAMRNLHVQSSDPIEIMVWSKTYNYLEGCCDACEEVANMLEIIVMKNS